MPNKMQLITELSNNVTKEITNTPENWLSFLDTASNNYKYSFNEQILIYAQRPDATVCTDIDTWNKRLHRWIKKGSKGIALITNDNGVQGLRHIFDISDTYDKFNRNVYVWQVEDDMQNEIIETLENRFGDLENKDNLADSIINSVTNLVEDNFQDYYSDFTSIVNNSYLEELDELNLELYFKNMMKNSISYMVLKRCGIDPKEYFDVEDFRNIVNFNTTEVISRLGIATSDIAEVELHEIYTTVLDLKKEKNKSHTFVNNKNEEYHEKMKIKLKGVMKMREQITYHQEGDYQIPDLMMPVQEKVQLGTFARMREKYIKENKRGLYTELMMKGTLTQHLVEIEKSALNRMELIINQLAKQNKVDEQMKAQDQMTWVGYMNNFKNQAQEIVMQELIYN